MKTNSIQLQFHKFVNILLEDQLSQNHTMFMLRTSLLQIHEAPLNKVANKFH